MRQAFKRGFKSWCENTSERFRKDLHLKSTDPLNPWGLAVHLGFKVWTPNDIPDLEPDQKRKLLVEKKDFWSATTICDHGKALIILNSSHSPARQSSSLMHEISHLIIDHKPARVDVYEDGLLILNSYDSIQEKEAEWFSETLLLPRSALLVIKSRRIPEEKVLADYFVSRDMLRMRMDVTGVNRQLNRRVRNARATRP